MPRTMPRYPSELRTRAVGLVRTGGRTIEAVAQDLGIAHPSDAAPLVASSVSSEANRAGVGAARVRLESARTRSRSQASPEVR